MGETEQVAYFVRHGAVRLIAIGLCFPAYDPVGRNVVVSQYNPWLVIPGSWFLYHKYIDRIRVPAQVHQQGIALVAVHIVVVDRLIEQAVRRVCAEIELNAHCLIRGIEGTKLLKTFDLLVLSVPVRIPHKVEMDWYILRLATISRSSTHRLHHDFVFFKTWKKIGLVMCITANMRLHLLAESNG